MEQLKDLSEIEGRTITKACIVGFDEYLVLVMRNDYIAIDVDWYGDSYSLRVKQNPLELLDQKEAGLISEDTYNRIKEELALLDAESDKKNRLRLYHKLKEEFEGSDA